MANSLDADLMGKHVIVHGRTVLAVNGFGSFSFTVGRGLFIEDADGANHSISGFDVERFANAGEVANFKEMQT